MTLLALLTLEALLGRPLLASLSGRVLALALRGKRAPSLVGGRYRVYLVRRLPGGAAALTLGEVVLIRGKHTAQCELHEREHVKQYRYWTSLPFFALYLASWLFNLARTRHPWEAYYRIPFEKRARDAERS